MAITGAIIQARLGSTRLPRKVLLPVWGEPLMWRQLTRTRLATSLEKIVVAIPEGDEEIAQSVEEYNRVRNAHILLTRGPEDDVMARYYGAAEEHEIPNIVRMTMDEPFIDPGVINGAVRLYASDAALDFVTNNLESSFPRGLDLEVIRRSALAIAVREATEPFDREHVSPFIRRDPRFVKLNMVAQENLSAIRLTVDTQADLDLARALYLSLGNRAFSTADILWLIERRPDLQELHERALRAAGQWTGETIGRGH